MSAAEKEPNPYRPTPDAKPKSETKAAAAGDDRELFVTTDIRSIPMMELRSMCSFPDWLMAIVAGKIFRANAEAIFACESRRLVKVDADQISRRVMKRFGELRPQIEDLGFVPNYYASLPAIGPIAAAMMTMSRPDGRIHFFAVQVALKTNDQVSDDGHFGYGTHLPGGGSILTLSPAKLPKPRRGIDRAILSSDDPLTVLKKHRERIRDVEIQAVAPREMFAFAERETRLEAEDLLRRKIIRPANAAEVGRIRGVRV